MPSRREQESTRTQPDKPPEPGSLSLASEAVQDREAAAAPEPKRRKLPPISDEICESCSDLAGELRRVVPENCAPEKRVHRCQVCRSEKIER